MKTRVNKITTTLPALVAGTLCTTGMVLAQNGTGSGTSDQGQTLQAVGQRAAPDGIVAGAPTCGDPACEYANDSGLDDNAIGLNTGDFAWLQYFDATPGCNIIQCIRVVFGPVNTAMPDTTPVRLFIYDDPNDDQDPSDAVLLWSDTTSYTVMNENLPGVFNEYATDPTVVNGGFFVCAAVDGEFPGAVDQTVPGGTLNWAAFNLTNPDNPLDAPGTLDTLAGLGLDGTWTLRAVGGSSFPPCAGDTNGDQVVDVNDLNNVILDWGTPGTNGGDLTGAVPGSPPDGIVDVNDLNAVIVNWGACPVANDNCVDRVLIGGSVLPDTNGTTAFSSVGATLDGTAPAFRCGSEVNDVWFNYSTPLDPLNAGGTLYLSTAGSTYDTILKVYDTQACPPSDLDNLLCVDDEGSNPAGDATGTLQGSGEIMNLANGQPIKIRIGGWDGDSEGAGLLNLVWAPNVIPAPDNDNCVDAILDPAFELVNGAANLVGQTATATPDPNAFPCGFPPGAPGVWYWFVGDGFEKTITLDCLNSDYDSIVNVYCYNGDCNALLCIGGDDDGCGMLGDAVPSVFTFCSAVGQTYAVFVNGSGGAIGSFEISIARGPVCAIPDPCEPPLAQDTCRQYEVLPGDGLYDFSTNNAQIPPDGPDNAGFDCNDFGSTQTWSDIWYCYTPDAMGLPQAQIVVSTCEDFSFDGMAGNADYDTDLVLYGPFANNTLLQDACNMGTLNDFHVACNDDEPTQNCGTTLFHSFIRAAVDDGQIYLIRVGGWGEGDFGSGQLLVKCLPADDDFCEFAEDLGVPATFPGSSFITDTTTATVDVFPLDTPPCNVAPVAPGRWIRVAGNGNTYTWELCAIPAFTYATRTTVLCGPCEDLQCFDEPTDGAVCDPFTEAGSFCSKAGDEYYFLIHGEVAADAGVAELTVIDTGLGCADPPCQPCAVASTCVGDADEAVGDANNANPEDCRDDGEDDLNGGCNVAIPAFGVRVPSVPFSICGTTSTYVNSGGTAVRDTDWHTWISDGSTVTWDVTADFLAHGILGELSGAGGTPDCVTITVIQGQFGLGNCLPNGITSDATLVSGDIALLFASIQTEAFGGQDLACTDITGGGYTADLTN